MNEERDLPSSAVGKELSLLKDAFMPLFDARSGAVSLVFSNFLSLSLTLIGSATISLQTL